MRDNGIGIPAHELSRVFERGFTGSNGRVRGGSTGMGLYLCRRLADCLGIGLEIMSECGVGTTVVLVFEEKKDPNPPFRPAHRSQSTTPYVPQPPAPLTPKDSPHG